MTDPEITSEIAGKPGLFSQVANIFVAPGQALDYVRSNARSWWLPLGILLVFTAAFSLWWALTVNLDAYHMAQMQMLTQLHPENADKYAHFIMHQGRGALMIGVVASLAFIAVVELLYALYLFLADKIFSADSKGYGQWFAFTTWTALPIVLATIASMIAFAVSNKTGLHPADVTSLNNLIFHLSPGDGLYKIAQFSILSFWVIGLIAFGLKRWCGHGTGKALAIAIAPYVVVYGVLYLI
ncbi:MAG: YIP1 family protein [Gammaproteobacteria bacterium]